MGVFDFLSDLLSGMGPGVANAGGFSDAGTMNAPVSGAPPINDSSSFISPETANIMAQLGSALGKAGAAAAGNTTGGWSQAAKGLGSLAESIGGGRSQANLYNKMAGVETPGVPPSVKRITTKPDGGRVIDFHPPVEQSKLATPQGNADANIPTEEQLNAADPSGKVMEQLGQSNLNAPGLNAPGVSPITATQSSLSAPMQDAQKTMLAQAMGGGQVPFLQALQRQPLQV
jgi:hypothetical protein